MTPGEAMLLAELEKEQAEFFFYARLLGNDAFRVECKRGSCALLVGRGARFAAYDIDPLTLGLKKRI